MKAKNGFKKVNHQKLSINMKKL